MSDTAPTLSSKPGSKQDIAPQAMENMDDSAEDADEYTSNQLTFFAADSPVRTSRWLDAVRDWLESGADFSSSSYASLVRSLPVGFSSRTSLGCCLPMTVEISASCSGNSPGFGLRPRRIPAGEIRAYVKALAVEPSGACWTLNTSDHPNGAVVSSLSSILQGDVDPKYYLSPKACCGILRRAEKRGKDLPTQLREALRARAEGPHGQEKAEDRTP